MACQSLPEILCCDKLYSPLLGALDPSPGHGGGLRALFLLDRRVIARMAHIPPCLWASPCFPPLRPRDVQRKRPLWRRRNYL
jgi:hypothetical protein